MNNIECTDNITDLAAALCKAQIMIEGAEKNKTNPAFRSKYADLGACWDACRVPLGENGLSIIQIPSISDGCVHLTTILLHLSGQSIRGTLSLPIAKFDAQGAGSVITYARRYSLCSMVGIAPDDDDGNGGVVIDKTKQKPEVKTYPAETFDKNFPAWEKAVKEGKTLPDGKIFTPEIIIAQCLSKGALTPEQITKIQSIKPREPGEEE